MSFFRVVTAISLEMGITIFNEREQESLLRAGKAAAATLRAVVQKVREGMSTKDIDELVRDDTERRGAEPVQLGYHGFPAAVCTSVNQVVCHGIPSPRVILRDGDILNVDVTSRFQGFVGDTSRMVLVGTPAPEAVALCAVAERCLWAGIEVVRPGAYLRDIAAAVSEVARAAGCSIVKEFGGHGIGRQMHQEPHVPFFVGRGRGARLRAGMAFTIEPMVNAGGHEVRILSDGWTVETVDGSWSAQYEHSVLVVDEGVRVLTDWGRLSPSNTPSATEGA